MCCCCRIPGPGGRSAAKPSLLAPPSTRFGAARTGIAPLTAARATRSPVQFQKTPKKLQLPSLQRSNQTAIEEETQIQIEKTMGKPVQSSVPETPAVSAFVPSEGPPTQSDTIRVLLRIKPSSGRDDKKCLEVAPDQRGVTLAPTSQQEKRFGFDRVFTENCQQDDIFQDAGLAAVENTIQGYNGSIFAYGQTGSGKTFTMLGGASANVHELRLSPMRGLTPRILDYLFQRLAALSRERNAAFYDGQEQERALQYTLACSYLEIYNEKIFDLLEPSGSQAAQQPKSLREDRNKEVYVDQLREIDVGSEEEALTLLQLGSQNRHISSTDMNRESSRSHAVFSVKLVLEERTPAGVRRTRRSCLHLVDLAGSEKQRQTRVHGKRLKEAAQINKSLSALGNVIMALVDVSNGQKRHVHYRDSKLTFLLRDALGGNAITSIVATIAPEEKYFTETLSTLKFAQRAKFIKNNAVQNEDADSLVPMLKLHIEKLQQEIATLRTSIGASGSISNGNSSEVDVSKDEHLMRLRVIAEAEAEARVQEKKKQNRWEPALEMMQKLLSASGALAPADLVEDGEEPLQLDRDAVEVRCDRLEMLLYRMICRFEEYKEVTYDPDRYKYGRRSHQLKPSKLQAPRMSMLPAPKRYSGAVARYHHHDNQEHSADDDETAAALAASEKRERELQKKVQEKQHRIDEMLRRSEEAEAENDLIRRELCELLEWKAFVEEERRRVSDAVPIESLQEDEAEKQQAEVEEVSTLPSEEMQEMQELLNVYRSLFDEVTELVYAKRPVLCSPPSPKSGSSVVTEDNSASYASGDEDDTNDDCISVDGFEPSEDGDSGVSDTYREIRRVNAFSSRLERKLDRYQDVIQRLEKELQTTQDELETSSAATKFAEFQLQQLRTLATDEESKQRQAEDELRKKLGDLELTVRAQRDEMAQVLEEKAAEDTRALEHEQEVARREVERLEDSLRNSSDSLNDDDIEKQQLESALAAAQKRIEDLEKEVKSAQSATKTSEILKSSDEETPVQLQKLLDHALADNAKLLETVRDLQGKRQRSGANLQLLSSLLVAAAGDNKDSDTTNEDNKEPADELTRLRRDIATLRLQRSGSTGMTDLGASGANDEALAKPAETIQRLALERATLRARLHRAQQTIARLELEVRRTRRNAAVSSSNGALSTEFLCGI